jgi:hypothetical protein
MCCQVRGGGAGHGQGHADPQPQTGLADCCRYQRASAPGAGTV